MRSNEAQPNVRIMQHAILLSGRLPLAVHDSFGSQQVFHGFATRGVPLEHQLYLRHTAGLTSDASQDVLKHNAN